MAVEFCKCYIKQTNVVCYWLMTTIVLTKPCFYLVDYYYNFEYKYHNYYHCCKGTES